MTSRCLVTRVVNMIGIVAIAISNVGIAEAQSDEAGQVTGHVVDQDRAPIAGAKITISSKDGSLVRSTVTDAQGEFSLTIGVGEYSIKVSASGFADAVRPAVKANGSSIEIVMSVAGANVSVDVEYVPEYATPATSSATKTLTPLRDIPQAVSVVTKEQMQDQLLTSVGDILRYTPGVTVHQGENNRDEVIIRGQDTSSSFFLNGVRDDVQYYRDPYNLERLETLKGPNAMIFGRGGGGGVINRVTKEADVAPLRQFEVQGGSFWNRRFSGDINQPINDKLAIRFNGAYENSDSFRKFVNLNRLAFNPKLAIKPGKDTKFTLSYEFARDRRVADRGITSFNLRPADVPVDTYYGNPDQAFARSNVNIVSGTFDQQLGKLNIHNRTTYGYYDRMYQNFVPGAVNIDGTLVTLTGYNNATRRKNLFSQTDLTSPAVIRTRTRLSQARRFQRLLVGWSARHHIKRSRSGTNTNCCESLMSVLGSSADLICSLRLTIPWSCRSTLGPMLLFSIRLTNTGGFRRMSKISSINATSSTPTATPIFRRVRQEL